MPICLFLPRQTKINSTLLVVNVYFKNSKVSMCFDWNSLQNSTHEFAMASQTNSSEKWMQKVWETFLRNGTVCTMSFIAEKYLQLLVSIFWEGVGEYNFTCLDDPKSNGAVAKLSPSFFTVEAPSSF